jgi:hypothetical protein
MVMATVNQMIAKPTNMTKVLVRWGIRKLGPHLYVVFLSSNSCLRYLSRGGTGTRKPELLRREKISRAVTYVVTSPEALSSSFSLIFIFTGPNRHCQLHVHIGNLPRRLTESTRH